MPRKKTQVPGQIDLPLSAPEPTTTKTKRIRKKNETTTRPKTKEPEKKTKNSDKDPELTTTARKRSKKTASSQTDIPVKKTYKKKKYTQAQYRAAVKIAEECGVVNAGKLINRFRIPANMALDILAKMQEEGIITAKGAVAKKKGIVWKEK